MNRKLLFIIGLAVACSAIVMCTLRDKLGTNSAPIINGERYIVVVIPSYNNSKWYQMNLASVFSQKYSNYHVIYIDDCSSDDTFKLVDEFIHKYGQESRVTLIKNEQRHGALYNLYHAIHSCDNHAIIATLDGDDWFKDDQALAEVNRAYRDPNVWLTYGQFEEYPGNTKGFCQPLPSYIINTNSYRKQLWLTSHLRTFYAGLFKQIKQEDLMYEGKFFEVTWDQAFMFPMLEMTNGHIKCIERVLYVYNQANPINDFKTRLYHQLHCERIIRRRTPYEPLDEAQARSFCVT